MGKAAEELSRLLTDSDIINRRKAIGEMLIESPDIHTIVMAEKLDIEKSLIKNDIEALFEQGHKGAIARMDNNLYRVQQKNEIEKTLKAYPFTDQRALAKTMKMKYSDLKKDIKKIRKDISEYDTKTKDLLNRRNLITQIMSEHPGKSLAEVSTELGIPLDLIAKDQESFDDPKYISLQNKYRIDAMLASISDDMDACETQFQLCVAIDPRSGSRWKEEKRKYKSLFIELSKMLPKQGFDVNVNINRSTDQRDAIRKAAKLTSG